MKRLLPAVAIAALLSACAHMHGPASLTLGLPDSGKTINAVVGQTIALRLDATPSTGYQWQVVTQPDPITMIVTDSGYDRPASDAPGAPGQAWWKLRTTGTGTTTFAVRYVRPWAPEPDAKQFTLTVNVKARK